MRKFKRNTSILACAAYAAVFMLLHTPLALYAASAPPPAALKGLSAAPSGIVLNNAKGRTAITFTHDDPGAAPPASSFSALSPDSAARYTARVAKYYFNEHNKGYRGKQPARVMEDRRDADFKPAGPFTAADLPSGMIYDVYTTNYLEFEEYPLTGNGRRTPGTTAESAQSNQLTVFTGIQLDAQLISFDKVRIVWDDVWYNEKRIYGYSLNVYSSGDTISRNLQSSIPIYQTQIVPGGPVSVNEAAGKLEYIYGVPYPGRVYSFEIVPVLSDVSGIVAPVKNGVVTLASRIAVAAVKLFEDTASDRITWDISWSNVTAGMGSERRYTAVYTLSKINGKGLYQILQVISNFTSTIIMTPRDPEDPENAGAIYEITAIVYANGEPLYVGSDMVNITSGPFTLRESETPYTPQAPALLLGGVSPSAGQYKADLWWNIPKRVSEPETNDYDVEYEIFLLDDPKLIDMLSDPETAGDITANFFEDGSRLTQGISPNGSERGYVYSIENLTPNTAYYIAVRAVKKFIDITDMSAVSKYSRISYVSFTTPPSAPFGQPPAPTTFVLKKDTVKPDSAEFSVRTVWYELLDKSSGEPYEWVWAPDYMQGEGPLPADYRKLSYEAGDQIFLFYAEYAPGMDLEKPETLPAYNYTVATVTAVNEGSPILSMKADGLSPNTVYVFWARASRSGQPLSYPSKAVIVTTPPKPNGDLETPVAPDFKIMFIGDTYVDLVWDKKNGYEYSVQYCLAEAFDDTGVTTVTVSTARIIASGADYFRVTGLFPDTLYFFRIRAEVTSVITGDINVSVWSDAKPARTRPYMPPAAPMGFGIRSGSGAVTEDSIFYEWQQIDGLIYMLEYSRIAAMEEDMLTGEAPYVIDVGAAFEFNLTGLLSNHKYYARLYAYDPATGLQSLPTYIVGATTLRGYADYDSNTDITAFLTGPYVKIDDYADNGVWHVYILGSDADRFAERVLTDSYADYTLDLSKPPKYTKTINLTVEGKVFDSLDTIKAYLEIKLSDKSFIIRPHTLSASIASSPAAKRAKAYRYEILMGINGGAGYEKPGGLILKTTPTGFDANILAVGVSYPVTEWFGKGLRVVVPFTGAAWYTSGVTQGVYMSPAGYWQRLETAVSFNPDTREGRLTFEYARPGTYFAADAGGKGLFSDVTGGGYSTYINKLGALGYTDARTGSPFRPNDPAAPAEAVGMVYRAMGYAGDGTGSGGGASASSAALSGSQYLTAAYKAGFIAETYQTHIKIEEALALVGRAYAVRAGVKVVSTPAGAARGYIVGLENVSEPVRAYAQFAFDNGLASPVIPAGGPFPAGRAVTRAEFVVFLYRALELLGEI